MKRLFRYFALSLLLSLSACGIFRNSADISYRRMLPSQMNDIPDQLISRKGYTLSYNCETKLPNWVFWHLSAEHATGDVARPIAAYHVDSKVPKPRATGADYRRSGYSRGHMCPAGDNKWDKKAMYESFAYSNICPQKSQCNSGVWNAIETMCREWAKEYGDVYIVSGPIVKKFPDMLGKNQVAVPEAFFKVVVCLNGRKKGIGFICDNTDLHQTMRQCVVTIEEIEDITGINFFPNFNERDRMDVEMKANLRDW
ncbi:MAG: DNA/RNA non-specific endonuclease [Bacteroidales bacterium]|nr:DNA/RNA non-specific endonuclease [Bacteroidales bacterium]